jgi:transposase, IS30 family
MKILPQQIRQSLTHESREMAQHRLFTQEIRVKVYLSHTQSPWERGPNENTNGLICHFFLNAQLTAIKSNVSSSSSLGHPRTALRWKTPYETFNQLLH